YGNIVLEEKFLPRTPTNFELVSDTAAAEVTLRVPQFRFTFKFTDQEFEKTPLPVEMDLKAMLKVSEAIEGMGRMAADLLKGLGGAKPNIGPKPKDPPKDDPPEEDAPADDPKKDVNPFEKKPPVKNLPKTLPKKKDG
ncbi:MAG: hypothetical protein VB862_02650, partial [Pirellulaceae bacterium]